MKAEASQEIFYSQLGKYLKRLCILVFQLALGDSLWLHRFCSFSRFLNAPKDDVALCVCVLKAKLGDERLHLSS